MRVRSRSLTAVLALSSLLAVAATSTDGELEATELTVPEPNAVVAFIDSGINPYHQVFRDESPRASEHPSTYLDGYPADAVRLDLTLDGADYLDSVRADCDVWKGVEPGKLYWVPGTRIVGAISFSPDVTTDCAAERPAANVLDTNGHGTMVASRGAGAGYGACGECLIVAIQWPASVSLADPGASDDTAIAAMGWAADNATWIDAQSNSWGPLVPGWDPTGASGLIGATPELVRKVEEVSQVHLAFFASGNGAAFRLGVLGHPTLLAPQLTPSAISVGGHDSGRVNTWPGFPPHLVSDSCASWAAHDDSTTESAEDVGSGTSASTPFVAGGTAQVAREARRILADPLTGIRDGVVARGAAGLVASGPLADGVFTSEELRRVVSTTATQRPEKQFEDGPPCGTTWAPYNATPVLWTDVPEAYPEHLHLGYGAVDRPSLALAFQVLAGEAEQPDRSDTDEFFATDAAARGTLYDLWTLGG